MEGVIYYWKSTVSSMKGVIYYWKSIVSSFIFCIKKNLFELPQQKLNSQLIDL